MVLTVLNLVLIAVAIILLVNPKWNFVLKKKKDARMVTAIAIMGVGLLSLFAVIDIPGGKEISLETFTFDKGSEEEFEAGSCEASPQVVITNFNQEDASQTVSVDHNMYRKVGDKAWTSFTQGTAFDVVYGENYEFITGVDNTNAENILIEPYGEFLETGRIQCKELTTIEVPMVNDEVYLGLSSTFYNENHDASAQTMTDGQTKTVFLKYESTKDEVFGNPFVGDNRPNVLCLDINKTAIDVPVSVKIDGSELERISTPLRHTLSTTDIAYCYEAPVVTDAGYEVELKIEAIADVGDDQIAKLYEAQWFFDENGNIDYGIEDEQGNSVGHATPESLTIDLTA